MTGSPDWRERATAYMSSLRGTGIRGLTENVLSLSVLQAANYLLPLITVPYLTRVLGVEKYGLVALAQAVIQYFIILTTFGFELSATREIATHRHDRDRVSRIFANVLGMQALLCCAGLGLLYLLTVLVPRLAEDPRVYLITYSMVLGRILFPVWFFQGVEKMKYSTALSLGARILFVFLIFVVIRSADDYYLVPLLNGLGMIVAGLIGIVVAVRHFKIRLQLPTLDGMLAQTRDSFQFFVAALSSSASSSFNTLVLGIVGTNAMVGYYAAAEKLLVAMRSGFYPLVNALYPYMAHRQAVGLFKRVFACAIGGALALAACVYTFNVDITRLIFGDAFLPSAEILRMFCLVVPVTAASMLLGYPFLAALGHKGYANYSSVVASAVHVLIIVALLSHLDGVRIATVLLVTETIALAIRIYGVRANRLWQRG
jgi:polysaccharide transporter, PST family